MVSNTRALSASSSEVPIRPRIRPRIRSRIPCAMSNPPARMAKPTRVGTLRLTTEGGREKGSARTGAIGAYRTRAEHGGAPAPAVFPGRWPMEPNRLPITCTSTLAETSGDIMIRRLIGIAAVAAAVALPVVTHAQGVPGGIERGSREGERAAGPVGAVVGGVIGGVVGGVTGGFGG